VEVVVWRWWIVDERTGKRRLTKWHMTEADALGGIPMRNGKPVRAKSATTQAARQRSSPRAALSATARGGSARIIGPCLGSVTAAAAPAPCICNPKGAVQWREILAEIPTVRKERH
jgi:hypothetical protein